MWDPPRPGVQTHASCIGSRILYHWGTREALRWVLSLSLIYRWRHRDTRSLSNFPEVTHLVRDIVRIQIQTITLLSLHLFTFILYSLCVIVLIWISLANDELKVFHIFIGCFIFFCELPIHVLCPFFFSTSVCLFLMVILTAALLGKFKNQTL